MRPLKDILEGLLGADFDIKDTAVFGKLGDFIDMMSSAKFELTRSGAYKSFDERLCDAIDQMAKSNDFTLITQAKAKKMISSKKPGTILIVFWTSQLHYMYLINVASGEYMHLSHVQKHERPGAPWLTISLEDCQHNPERVAWGTRAPAPCYVFSDKAYEYFKKAIVK